MARNPVKIAFPLQLPRQVSPRLAADTAKMLEASGVVDDLLIYDYLVSFCPRSMWTPDVTPLAAASDNDDSYHDAFILAAIAMAASNLGVCVMTDALRRGPWISQTMCSLADATTGQVTLALGAGEARHGQPFGYDRKEGLGRLKDMMKIWRQMLDCDGPFDFNGKYWKLEHSYLGTVRPARRPKLWALGGGPKLIEAAARDADGLLTQIPGVWATAGQCSEMVARIREVVANNGRDPDRFDIGISATTIIHDDPAEIDKALEHPLVKLMSALFGRFTMTDWIKEGHEPPFPADFHYANHFLPVSITRQECETAIKRMSREMVRKSSFVGSPAEVAAQLQKYVDAGGNWIAPVDLGSFVSQDPMGPVNRTIKVASILKAGVES